MDVIKPALPLTKWAARFAALAILLGACGGGSKDAAPTAPAHVLTSVVVALAPTTIQVGQSSTATASGLDQNGAAIAVGAVSWGTSDPTKVSVSNTGLVTALAPGSATVTATSAGKSGAAPITVTPAVIAVTSILPAVLTPGAMATVSGSGFSPVAASNSVMIDGVAATVSAATAAQLTFSVPQQLPCQPLHQATIKVGAFGAYAQGTQALRVGALKSLPVGGAAVLTLPADLYCTELPAGTSGYLLTVYSIAQSPTATVPFRLRGDTSSIPAEAATSASLRSIYGGTKVPPPSFSAPPGVAPSSQFSAAAHARVMDANAALYPVVRRAFQQRMARGAIVTDLLPSPISTAAVPPVGSTRKFRVNQFTVSVNGGGNCSSYSEITARLVYAGTKGLVYEDVAAPLAHTMDSYLTAMGQEFDATMYRSDSTYFGDPLITDAFTDGDQHLSMVFTPSIPAQLAGFVTSCDFYPRDSVNNTSSNLGEMFYGIVPTVAGTGFSSNTPDEWLRTMRTTVVHEVKHIASYGARLTNGATTYEESWLEEGMARMAEEMWLRNNIYHVSWKSDATYGATVYCDVRPSIVPCVGAPVGMVNHFSTLWQVMGAPSTYSMFGRVNNTDFHFYAETWSWVRWALDRYAANEATFLRGITQARTTGLASLAYVTGQPVDAMYGLWALSLVWDDNATFAGNSDVQFPTWNCPNVYAGLAADFPASYSPANPFVAWTLTTSAFAHDNSRVVGGGFDLYQISGTTTGGQTLGLVGYGGTGTAPSTLRIAISRTK